MNGGTTPTAILRADIAELSKGEWLGLDLHPTTEIDYRVEGEGTVTVEGIAHRLSAGIAITCPRSYVSIWTDAVPVTCGG